MHRHGLPDEAHAWSLDSKRRTPAEKKKLADVRQCKICDGVFPRLMPKDEQICPQAVPDEDDDHLPPKLPEGCIFQAKILVERPGQLEEYAAPTRELGDDPLRPAWAGGLNIKLASGRQWYALMDRAGDDLNRLRQIQQARKYKRGWVHHVVEAARKQQGAGR